MQEDERQQPVGGADREQVQHDRDERDDERPEGDGEHEEAEAEHEERSRTAPGSWPRRSSRRSRRSCRRRSTAAPLPANVGGSEWSCAGRGRPRSPRPADGIAANGHQQPDVWSAGRCADRARARSEGRRRADRRSVHAVGAADASIRRRTTIRDGIRVLDRERRAAGRGSPASRAGVSGSVADAARADVQAEERDGGGEHDATLESRGSARAGAARGRRPRARTAPRRRRRGRCSGRAAARAAR